MLLKHAGLACRSEANADRFYRDLLGLDKSKPKTLPVQLSRAIFNFEAPLQIINYQSGTVHFEIFIAGPEGSNTAQIAHQCLEVDNLMDFLEKCRTLEIEIRRIPKGDKTLTFIKDFDGNLFEIKGF